MDTRKLYYEDPELKTFTAQVTGCEAVPGGWAVTLDQTAFYPEGGGQAWDTGFLGGARVLSVKEKSEQVVHLCDGPLKVGSTVEGSIDWARRFDLMQQHTGEHILSGLIHAAYGYHNVGFHVGKEAMEVDFDGPIPPDALQALEEKANQAVWEDLPLHCWYPSPEELPQVGYRTKRELPWPVRVVEVPGYDKCACCGVHVARTGQVGMIKILSCTKFHSGVRLEMLCGQRAYRYLCRVFDENRQVSQIFSAQMLATGEAARKASEALARQEFRAASLQKRIFAATAESYRGKGNILHFEQDLTPGQVRELAEAIAPVCGGIAVVFSGAGSAGYALCLVSEKTDVRPLGSLAIKSLHGRGGGKPDAFQGVFQAHREEIEEFFHKNL